MKKTIAVQLELDAVEHLETIAKIKSIGRKKVPLCELVREATLNYWKFGDFRINLKTNSDLVSDLLQEVKPRSVKRKVEVQSQVDPQ